MEISDNSQQPRLIKETLASFVVFLVALPLSMGIALACGLSPAQGLLTGIIGGLVVGLMAGSPLQVSGASASLTVFICDFIAERGIEFLGPVILMAGLIQVGFGFFGLGRYFRMVSPAVLYGILAGVGMLIVLSQFHVMFDLAPHKSATESIAAVPSSIAAAKQNGSQAQVAIMIAMASLSVIFVWRWLKLDKYLLVPGGLPAIIVAASLTWYFSADINMVVAPHSLGQAIRWPGFGATFAAFCNPEIYLLALELALIASTESMLSVAAIDQMHNGKRSRYNLELMAQGGGNILCGLVGALPLTGAIVRSSVNIEAGAKTRWATVLHGLWLLLMVLFLPWLLEMVPIAALAALLVFTGLRLVDFKIMRQLWNFGWIELVIFLITAATVVAYSLLMGILVGLVCAAAKTLYRLCQADIKLTKKDNDYHLKLSGSLVFLNLPELSDLLATVPAGARLQICFENLNHIDHACLEELRQWGGRHSETEGRMVVDWDALLERHHTPLYVRPVWQPPTNGSEIMLPGFSSTPNERCLNQLIRGASSFSSNVYPQMAETYKALEQGQKPHTLFITCSDSRVLPDLITLSAPGNIFTVRNAGGIIPDATAAPTSEAASVEFAVDILNVKNIVICGHSDCGAVKCLCNPPHWLHYQRPALESWLSHASHGPADYELLLRDPEDTDLDYAVKLHVLRQLEKIRSYPHVEPLLEAGTLRLAAWYYNIAQGCIWAYDPELRRYERLTEQHQTN
ncbi:MAG: hypothetical protein K2W82_18095 [Candidatus Obscuribacterales bacterium]|nr:hypothetical protein [Candidatus Obscuribacterales bacterium]